MSAEQQTEVKRRSSRAAREQGKRRRRSRTAATPQVQTSTEVAGEQSGVTPKEEVTRAEAKRIAREASSKSSSFAGRIVNSERLEGLRRFIRDTISEIKKVIWPDRETTRNLTIVVIALSVVLGIVLGGIDFVLYQVFEAF